MTDLKALQSYLNFQKQAAELEATAKKEMQERFRELLEEAAQLAVTYRKTFGAKLEPPRSVKTFAVAEGRPGAKSAAARKKASASAPAQPASPPPVPVDPKKLAVLQRTLANWEQKLQAAVDEKDKRRIQDKLYMIEDEIRLLTNPPR